MEDGVGPSVAGSICVVTMNASKKKKKKRFCVALFFSTAHPAYSAQRSERVNHGSFPTFSGDNPNNLFPAFETGGNTEMKTSDCTPNATNLFLRNEASVSPSHILNRMVMMLNLFLCFYLFLTLKLGGWVCFTLLNISTLKLSLLFCPHILNVSQYFIQKLPCPSHCQSVGVNYIFSLLKRRRYHYWWNQNDASKCTVRCRSAFIF